jgi:single-strand DNA-binding protein
MLNQVVLVGRLVHDVVVNKTEKGKKIASITLAVPRSFKNMDGLYDTDFIDCVLWENIAVNTKEYCRKGNVVCIRGRIQSRIIESDGINKNVMQLVAEKVTFLASDRT